MARVEFTEAFGNLGPWAGQLLQDDGGTTIVTRSAKSFVFRFGEDHGFAGFTVRVSGRGFSYDGGEAIAGTMTGITFQDASGATILTISNIDASDFAADFAQFHSNIFGSRVGENDGPGPDANSAWSHLLAGNDTFIGSDFRDNRILPGVNAGNDTFQMGSGDDQMGGGIGNDRYDGGDGNDVITFRETTYNAGQTAIQGIEVDVAAGRIKDAWGGTDTFVNVERFEGSRFNDTFIGDGARNEFSGLRGNDVFIGGGDQDRLHYDNDYWQGGRRGIVVDLQTSVDGQGRIKGTIRDGFGNRDTTYDIERVRGTRFDDKFVGSTQNNSFWGGEGKDSYDGDDGFDSVRFNSQFTDTALGGINIDLTRQTGQVIDDGFGNTETMTDIESVIGGWQADRMKGNSANNQFQGGEGADTLIGGGGSDTFYFDGTYELDAADTVTDFRTAAGANRDYLAFYIEEFAGMTDTVNLVNGTRATSAQGQFIFNRANDTLFWDADGTGSGAALAIVRLTGVNALSADNILLWD